MNKLNISYLGDLRKVVMITHLVTGGVYQIKMFRIADDGSLKPIRWTTAGDSELYSCTLQAVTDAIIPLMTIVTGKKFERTASKRGKNIFERVDLIESRKLITHN